MANAKWHAKIHLAVGADALVPARFGDFENDFARALQIDLQIHFSAALGLNVSQGDIFITCSCRNALICADSLDEGPPGAFMVRGDTIVAANGCIK
jgi:hypothetical protein